MAGLLTDDEALMDDIIGLIDLHASSTPRMSATGSTAPSFAPIADGASPSSASSDDNVKASPRSVRRRETEKFRQRRYRQRLRNDRDALQKRVDELSEQLEALKQASERRKRQEETETLESRLACSKWKKEARSQRSKRQVSEAQKKQLVSAVNYQAEYIKSLRRMHNARGITKGATSTLYTVPGVLHTTYLQQLDGSFARVDTVMNACGVVSLPETTLNSVFKRQSDGGVACFQHVNKTELPYSFQQTCKVLRDVETSQQEPTFGGFEVAPDQTVFLYDRVVEAQNVGSLAQRFVSRQYFEENRAVLVWKVSSEGEEGFRGLHAEETGWICVEPSPGGGVVLSACVQQVPMRMSSPYSPEPATKPFYDLLSESLEADRNGMTAWLGSVLLEDVLTGIECE